VVNMHAKFEVSSILACSFSRSRHYGWVPKCVLTVSRTLAVSAFSSFFKIITPLIHTNMKSAGSGSGKTDELNSRAPASSLAGRSAKKNVQAWPIRSVP